MARLLFSLQRSQPSRLAPASAPPSGPDLPLEGPRLRIRPLQRQDLDKRQQWIPFDDPLHLIWDMPPCSARENDSWFAQITGNRHRLAYGVDDRAGRLVGMISLREICWGHSARLGIAFSSSHVGMGYGSEALRLFLPYYFLTLRFRKMVLDVAAANQRAVRCYTKAHFRQVGTHWQPVEGSLDPQVLERPQYAHLRHLFRWSWGRAETLYYDMELSREDWENHQAREDNDGPLPPATG